MIKKRKTKTELRRNLFSPSQKDMIFTSRNKLFSAIPFVYTSLFNLLLILKLLRHFQSNRVDFQFFGSNKCLLFKLVSLTSSKPNKSSSANSASGSTKPAFSSSQLPISLIPFPSPTSYQHSI